MLMLGEAPPACSGDIACPAEDAAIANPAASTEPNDRITPLAIEVARQFAEAEVAADPQGNEIVVTGAPGAPAGDPAEQINAKTYAAAQAVDTALVEPIAKAYGKGLPEPIRDGIGNALSNLGEPINFLNFLLQLKLGKAVKSVGRFAINTTLGVGGLFEVAAKEPFGLEHESNGLANTLAYYGVGPGPYLYLPLIGSTTVRDLIGRLADLSVIPLAAGKPFNDPYYAIPAGTLHSLEDRLEIDKQINSIREKCGDPYAATRDIYLIQRQVEINKLRGRPTSDLGELGERLDFNCDIDVMAVLQVPTGLDRLEQEPDVAAKVAATDELAITASLPSYPSEPVVNAGWKQP